MKRYMLGRVMLLVVIMTACVAFPAFAEQVEIEVEGGRVSNSLVALAIGGSSNTYTTSSTNIPLDRLRVVVDDKANTYAGFYTSLTNSSALTVDVKTDVFDFSEGFTLYMRYYGWSIVVDTKFIVRIEFSNGSYSEIEIDRVGTSGVYIPYEIDEDIGLTAVDKIIFTSPKIGNMCYVEDIQLFTKEYIPPEPEPPPEPADLPSPPAYGGSMNSFEVTAKNNGKGGIGFYYEDIVNNFYQTAMSAGALSYAQYPYTTVMSFLDRGHNCFFLVATDIPFFSNVYLDESNKDWISNTDFPQGVSGIVFALFVPSASLMAGENYVFRSLTSYTGIGPYDFASYIRDELVFPFGNGTFYPLKNLASLVMSFEANRIGIYAICSNYALSPQSHDTFINMFAMYPIKQSFKFAETWAQLLRMSSGTDQTELLTKIMESLRSSDLSVTVYDRIEQIYNLMSDTTTLSPDDPIQSQIDKSVEALNEWAGSIGDPEIGEVLNVTSQISSSLDSIISSLGILAVLGTIGLILGVIKVALQR